VNSKIQDGGGSHVGFILKRKKINTSKIYSQVGKFAKQAK